MSEPNAKPIIPSRHMTKDELRELESAPKTPFQIFIDRLVCFSPVIAGALALAEYYMLPNLPGNESTDVYAYFIGVLMAAVFAVFLVSFINKKVFYTLRYKAPFYSFIFLMFLAYDWLTLKTGLLVLPYFPWVDQVLWAFISDRAYMAECTVNSLILLFTGYFTGAGLGLVTGVACGYNRRINYWIAPFMKLLGAIPSTTWLPVVMVLASTLFKGSVFIIALGVWFSVTIATQTGINNIDKSFFEAARTLGAKGSQLVFRIAIPFVMPNIFQGLTQGMSSACTALLVAEMIGVESGLGWYISWQKSWAQYGKMYAAIVLICVIFVVVNALLTFIRRRVLRWQEGAVHE
ncbi:ABC transporter permease [uncultured Cloacibacillus sp.]|uniref:ABC transporter permease n=1 Tax=uncultured Cloacibacillus sp. TaxID=889794 RepID=UPI0026DDA6CF|nr:ABC transporter permease subunit [uncultured Cloacibacillus sp.]